MNLLKTLGAAIFAAALPCLASAQTAPNWSYRYVPTQAEWNSQFALKQDYLGAPPLLRTGGIMSGLLTTATSTTSLAGLNIPPGTAPTSPNDGDVWTTAAGLFVRINGTTIGPLSGATSSSFGNTSPIALSFPSGIVTYACPTCGVTGSPLSQFAATTSAQFLGTISDETGSGVVVGNNAPTLISPTLGAASATSINKVLFTAPASSATLTIANGKTLTATNSVNFTGTDGSSVAFGAGGTIAYISNNLSIFAATTSAQLAGVLSDETGTGLSVFNNSPSLTTPALASPSFTGTATGTNAIPLTVLANLAANTFVGSLAGGAPTALTINGGVSCTNALTWVNGSGFGCNATAGTGTVTSVTCGTGLSGGTITATGTCAVALTNLTNSLISNVTLNNISNYFDGPSVAQGTSGTWFASGSVSLIDTSAAAGFQCKLWDGTTVIDSGRQTGAGTGAAGVVSMHLSGILASPAGNIRISCNDLTSTNGSIQFNTSGGGKDSTVSAHRIQ